MAISLKEAAEKLELAGCVVDVSELEWERVSFETAIGKGVIYPLGDYLYLLSGCAEIVFTDISKPFTGLVGVTCLPLSRHSIICGSIALSVGE